MRTSGLKYQVEKHPVIFFFLLAFLISWIGWGMNLAYAMRWTSIHSIVFTLLGGLGPAIAAVVTTWIVSGIKGIGRLFGALFRKGARWHWFILALALQPLITLTALGIQQLFMEPDLDFSAIPGFLTIVLYFAVMLVTIVWEEIGWRGFALPMLQSRFSPLISSLILGLFLILWHLPLMLNPIEELAVLPIWAQLPYTLALSVLYTWLYNNANGNLSVVTIFHAMTNLIALLILWRYPDTTTLYLINVAITILVAVGAAILNMSPKRNKKKVTEP